jgi:hypothetical protein
MARYALSLALVALLPLGACGVPTTDPSDETCRGKCDATDKWFKKLLQQLDRKTPLPDIACRFLGKWADDETAMSCELLLSGAEIGAWGFCSPPSDREGIAIEPKLALRSSRNRGFEYVSFCGKSSVGMVEDGVRFERSAPALVLTLQLFFDLQEVKDKVEIIPSIEVTAFDADGESEWQTEWASSETWQVAIDATDPGDVLTHAPAMAVHPVHFMPHDRHRLPEVSIDFVLPSRALVEDAVKETFPSRPESRALGARSDASDDKLRKNGISRPLYLLAGEGSEPLATVDREGTKQPALKQLCLGSGQPSDRSEDEVTRVSQKCADLSGLEGLQAGLYHIDASARIERAKTEHFGF